MWKLDNKKGWALKNWCLRTVVLEKIFESPLDSKEIKPVNPKGNQPWMFTGRTDCWSWSSSTLATWCKQPTHWKRLWCWERLKARGEGDDRWLDGITDPLDMSLSYLRRWWRTGKPGMLQPMALQTVGHNWATEQQQWFQILHLGL